MEQFVPEKIYYEPTIVNYELGKELLNRYEGANIPFETIENHNNIESLRTQPNSNFTTLKRYLIIGTRKTHKYVPNEKVSDFLVPYTSSGCSAMCLYCYLVCNYNKCSYMRLFVNREEMMRRLVKKAGSFSDDKVFEIGSNSDLILENTITQNLPWTIHEFLKSPKGKLTFPTKFHMVDPLLNLSHQGRVITRVSLNPQKIIQQTEFKTSGLFERIEAINKLSEADYPIGILVAPIIFVDGWKELYTELFQQMHDLLSVKAKQKVFFEAIFMTYSFVHQKINEDAFPQAMQIYSKEQMTGRGRGKYWYKQDLRREGTLFFQELFEQYFRENLLLYIV